jgi:pimeloyl-ACP methyl ester carboxylesterase
MTDPIPLILVPGLLCDRQVFGPQIASLKEVASILVADNTSCVSIGDTAKAALAAAPQRFALCGLSMGGYVCLELLRRAPDRVSQFALISTNARSDSEAAQRSRQELLTLAARGKFAEAVDDLIPHLLHADRLSDPELTGLIQAMAGGIGPTVFARQQRAIMGRVNSRPFLADIACRTLVICGREDALMPLELHLEMAANIPDATLVVLPRCGHLATIERPDAVADQLALWLRA